MRRILLAAACVLVLAAVGLGIWRLAVRDPGGSQDEAGAPNADPTGVAWERTGTDTFGSGTDLVAVARAGSRFVAVGKADGGGAVWSSPDGHAWEAVPADAFAVGEEPTGVAARGEDVIATAVADETTPLTWVSHDEGATWARSELPGVPLGQVRGVAISHDPARGAVVGGATLGERRDAAVWWSADGTTWQPVDDPDLRGEGADLAVLAITATADGFVAVGTENDRSAAVWLSTDGREWERVTSDSFTGEGDLSMWGVAAGPSGIAAVGHAGGDRIEPVAWFSVDGRTWERVALDASGDRTMWGISASTQGWVAVGAAARDTRVALWYSVDGREWTQYDEIEVGPDVGSVAAYSVAASDAQFVAVGGESTDLPVTTRGLALVTS